MEIAHRAALLYSFATGLIAVFVELSAWPTWLNLTAAMVLVFEQPEAGTHIAMAALILGEIGGFAVLLAGFVVSAGQCHQVLAAISSVQSPASFESLTQPM